MVCNRLDVAVAHKTDALDKGIGRRAGGNGKTGAINRLQEAH